MGAEKTFETRIKTFLKNRGFWFIKYWGGGEFTKAGVPDILCCINGYFVAIEVKGKNGKPTDLQLFNLAKIHKNGGFAFLLYPDDFEAFCEIVNDLEYSYMERAKENYKELSKVWRDRWEGIKHGI